MKRFILICLLIFGLSSSVNAISLIGSGITAGGCNTVINLDSQDTNMDIGSAASNQWGALVFTPTGADTVKTFYIMLGVNRTDDMVGETVTASLCTTLDNSPTETCTNADATLDATTLTVAPQAVKFNIAAGYVLTDSANGNAVRIYFSKADAGDYIEMYYLSTGDGRAKYNDDPATSWTAVDTTATAYFIGKDCVE